MSVHSPCKALPSSASSLSKEQSHVELELTLLVVLEICPPRDVDLQNRKKEVRANLVALKSQYDSSNYLQATVFLIMNNAAQGILSSLFFKYADTSLKKYSSTVATTFTGIASAALFGHVTTMNFLLGISIEFIYLRIYVSFFSPLAKVKDEQQNGSLELSNSKDTQRLLTAVRQTTRSRFCPDEKGF
ncbi:hypothetical protein IGI04_013986 [Brassica rapa subsp. trilocularis]|uniref:Uncharacterized protein n=1 Tax=Brassica rapa subsp. trilocularis TaxID=1813537 RepID=A0ABQ7NAE6_BRACM|nr:hypothetical protein IGI04_013986 [Brassica rapa subsp. trilocularis]